MRGGAAGYFDFLASWWPAVRRQNSGNMPEADGARSWKTNPDLWYPALLMVAGILFFSDALFSSKNFYFRDILTFHYPASPPRELRRSGSQKSATIPINSATLVTERPA